MKTLITGLFGILVNTFVVSSAPNVLFFLVDDLGQQDLSCYGSTFYETPAIDKLAAEGMLFNQGYAAHPRCVPSRYALITGRYPARSGIPGNSYNLDPTEKTMAHAFKDAGYKTFFAGKWHLSKEHDQYPENMGFDINIAGGHAGAPQSYIAPYNVKGKADGHGEIAGLDDAPEGEYLTDRLTQETIDFLKIHQSENPTQPFFIYLSHYGVHTPFQAKQDKTLEKYKAKSAALNKQGEAFLKADGWSKQFQDNPVYAAMIHSVDESMERIMSTLKELGLEENTIIVFTSDHGGLSNRGFENNRSLATSNLPLRAGKGHNYEGGIRVPLIVKMPGVTEPGTKTDAVVTGTDHFPMLLAATNNELIPSEHKDGANYLPALNGGDYNREGPLFWHSPKARPVNTGDTNCSVWREGDFKLLEFYDEDRIELYNVVKDPDETKNIAEEKAFKAKKMLAALHAFKEEISAPHFELKSKTKKKRNKKKKNEA